MEITYNSPTILRASIRLVTLAFIFSCSKMSEMIPDKNAGFNGSFEFTKSGLPVNWFIYSPRTIPNGDYDLVFDPDVKKDGTQSLKFEVRQCSANGGWHSPGMFQTIPAKTGKSYKISFWLKNNGTEFNISIGSERPGALGRHDGKVFRSKDTIESWQQVEYIYLVPAGFSNIRFELTILQPGKLWIDDVKIQEMLDD